MTQTADVIVLGVGPGGEVLTGALLKAGVSVIAIEAELVGGECPYWGCIPSKMVIRAGTTLAETRRVDALAGHAQAFPDWAPVAARIRKEATDNWDDAVAAARITDNGGTLVRGRGVVTGPRTVDVDGTTYSAKRALVIATGSKASAPPVTGLDEVDFWTNREALKTEKLPASMIVLGGGAIGCELAQAYRRFGTQITIVEFAPRLISLEEPEASEIVRKSLVSEGIDIRTSAAALSARGNSPTTVELSDGTSVTAEVLLVAAGRKVVLKELGADSIGAGPENGHDRALPVDDLMRVIGPDGKPIDGVYGIGDVVGKGAFTHVATAHGRMVADQLTGRRTVPFSKRAVGRVTFTDPEVGAVGLIESGARDQGYEIAVATYPMEKVTRGWIHGPGNEGILKIVIDTKTTAIIGATVVGPHAGEVLSGFTAAVAGKIPIDTLRSTVWAYPTYHRGYDAVFDAVPEALKTVR